MSADNTRGDARSEEHDDDAEHTDQLVDVEHETDADAEITENNKPARAGAVGVIALVLALLLATAGVYWVMILYPAEEAAQASVLEQLQSRLDALDGSVAEASAGLAEESSSREGLVTTTEELQREQAALSESVSVLYARESEVSLDWTLAEAEYLVLAATQRLALERDVSTAAAALQSADRSLRSAEHPDLIGLREQLAADIGALEAVNLPDVEGLAIYLAQTVSKADDLPGKPIADIDMRFSSVSEEQISADNWRSIAKAMWTDLKSLVEVKDGQLPDGVLFDPELRYFLQQNLKLELASARLSVLRRDNDNFRAACDLITNLLERYYDAEDASVESIITHLNDARDIDLNPGLPNISGSLDAVRAKRRELRSIKRD